MAVASHALFIIDASHSVEEELLRSWIDTQKLSDNYDTADYVVLPIAENPEDISEAPLNQHLTHPKESEFIPVRVVWQSSLDSPHSRPRFRDLVFGNRRKPSKRLAERIIKNHPERVHCVAGKAASLATLCADYSNRSQDNVNSESLAEYIANQAALALHVAERRLRGSRYRVPKRVVSNMFANERFKHELVKIAERESTSVEALLERAKGICKELIARPSSFWQDSMEALNRQIISLGYDKKIVYDTEKIAKLKLIAREKPCVLLWTHKTHIDGFAFASILFREDFPAAHTLGGVNMAFGGLGFIARNSSAIFIRRNFAKDSLYKLILRHYLGYLLSKRFPLTWAFEGTRSRVGKLMPPRYGILKYVLESVRDMDLDELQIVPVALNYDLINDVSDYVAEQQGAIKTPESLRWFVGYLRRFKTSHGRIYLDFGEPIKVTRDMETSSSLDIQKIAFQVGVRANKVSPITLTSLLCLILLGIAPRALTEAQLRREIDRIRDWSMLRGIPMTDSFEPENESSALKLGSEVVQSGLVTLFDQGPDVVFAIAAERHGIANYYRNSIVHHFIVKSIAELALLRVADYPKVTEQGFWNQIELLRDSFKFEFFYNPSDAFRQQVDEELCRYDEQWEMKLQNDPDFAMSFLRQLTPHYSHSTLQPYIDAYAIVAGIFARLQEGETLSL